GEHHLVGDGAQHGFVAGPPPPLAIALLEDDDSHCLVALQQWNRQNRSDSERLHMLADRVELGRLGYIVPRHHPMLYGQRLRDNHQLDQWNYLRLRYARG